MIARINEAAVAELAPGIQIKLRALALIEGPLVPANAQPAQIFDNPLRIVWLATVGIEIFYPKDGDSATFRGTLARLQESRCVTQVQITGRCGRNPTAVGISCGNSVAALGRCHANEDSVRLTYGSASPRQLMFSSN